MQTEEKLNKIAQDLYHEDKSEKDVLVIVTQILSSMYNEQQRDREEVNHHYQEQKELLEQIRDELKANNKAIANHENRISRLEWAMGIAITVVGISTAWAVPEVLSVLFP